MLRGVLRVYQLGLVLGTCGVLLLGGFVLLLRRWLDDAPLGPGGLSALMGGVPVRPGRVDPDADFGPILQRPDAPRLFDLLGEVAAEVDVRPPEEVRLSFLPCCGVVAWDRSRALLLGLPLLPVLEVGELRAVLAHELAHLARGDATWAARLVRSVELLDLGLHGAGSRPWGPLRWWGLTCFRLASRLLGPIAEGQEARADRCSAAVAGGEDAASALIKVALVQPLFRELLDVFSIEDPTARNLYATFRQFWDRLPPALIEAMRLDLIAAGGEPAPSSHPPLADRVANLLANSSRRLDETTRAGPAVRLLGDPEWIEQMMHDRLFNLYPLETSVFHHAGTQTHRI